VRDGSWSIAAVARMSGVTARTLRHYDAVGLLPPAWVAADGRRHYGRKELLRLQRILLLRELGLGLPAIAAALARGTGDTAVLRAHRDRVQELVALHHRVVSLFWAPDAEAYANLGALYVADERFRRSIGEDVVDYLRDAMGVYADTRLR
jgi:DNA-binding transcriptional MerR regulator